MRWKTDRPSRPAVGPARPMQYPASGGCLSSHSPVAESCACPFARTAAAAALPPSPICRSLAMSRGTRRNDDLWTMVRESPYTPPPSPPHPIPNPPTPPKDPNPDEIPYPQLSYPKGYDIGTGRLKTIRTALLSKYNQLSKHNAVVAYFKPLLKDSAELRVAREKIVREAESDARYTLGSIRDLIREMLALGRKPLIPSFLQGLKTYKLVPFGSMSYLAKRPHYFPPLYDVPSGLPCGLLRIESLDRIINLGDANVYLRTRYNKLVRGLNLICFYRHHRIRQGYLLTDNVPCNKLQRAIGFLRFELSNTMRVLKRFAGVGGLFRMPKDLRMEILKVYSIILPLMDYSVLFCTPAPHQVIPQQSYYLFLEDSHGFYLFHANGFDNHADCSEENLSLARDSLDNLQSFSSIVRLLSFFPYTDNQDSLMADYQESYPPVLRSFLILNLPDPAIFKHYMVGLKDDRLCLITPDHTGIPCTWNELFQILERGTRIHLDHLLM